MAPAGSGSVCIQAAPHALQTALSLAQDGDTIYMARGICAGAAVITLTKSITPYGGWDGVPSGPT